MGKLTAKESNLSMEVEKGKSNEKLKIVKKAIRKTNR
jgi:hypothetical protein